jgi:hypothetical protein
MAFPSGDFEVERREDLAIVDLHRAKSLVKPVCIRSPGRTG